MSRLKLFFILMVCILFAGVACEQIKKVATIRREECVGKWFLDKDKWHVNNDKTKYLILEEDGTVIFHHLVLSDLGMKADWWMDQQYQDVITEDEWNNTALPSTGTWELASLTPEDNIYFDVEYCKKLYITVRVVLPHDAGEVEETVTGVVCKNCTVDTGMMLRFLNDDWDDWMNCVAFTPEHPNPKDNEWYLWNAFKQWWCDLFGL